MVKISLNRDFKYPIGDIIPNWVFLSVSRLIGRFKHNKNIFSENQLNLFMFGHMSLETSERYTDKNVPEPRLLGHVGLFNFVMWLAF